jgi:uncharacterized protein (DUF433 family)
MLSFLDLAEAHVLLSTRQFYGVRPQKLRKAVAYLTKHSSSKHPLLSTEFHTDGKNIFVKTLEETISASEKGQLSFQSIINSYLERIEFDELGAPARLFPFRVGTKQQAKRIVIDPLISSGRPVIAGSGVPVSVLISRHKGGETFSVLAADYALEPGDIEEAIQYFDAA